MRWILAITGACLLGWAAGRGGGVVGFIFGWAVGALASRPAKPALTHDAPAHRAVETLRPPAGLVPAQASPERPAVPQMPADNPFEIKVVFGTSPRTILAATPRTRSKPKPVWHPPNQSLDIDGLQIAGGMVYTLERAMDWPGEPSAIIPSLRVDPVAADPTEDFGYYAGYDRITPAQRRSYLEWLAAGRTDADPARRSLGHLFLFFYGVERRVILDRDRDPALLEEIIRLLQQYGPAHRARSWKNCFLRLLHFGGWQLGGEAYRVIWPRLLEFDGERADAEGLRFVLASLYQRGEPMDWSVGYRVALANEESQRSNVVSRTREQFWALFAQRFAERYPAGLTLRAGKRPTQVPYRTASNAISQVWYSQKDTDSLQVDLPDVLGTAQQFEALPKIWNSCVEALTNYSRAISSKKTGDAAALAAWHALPNELRRTEAHPVREAFDELLTDLPREEDQVFVPAGTLAALAGVGERAKLTSVQSQQVVTLALGLGWNLAPDPVLLGLPLSWSQELVLYPAGPHEVDALRLRGVVWCLYLAIAIAAAHGEVGTTEMEVFYKIVALQIEQETEWQTVRATEAALRRDSNVALRAIPQIARAIPAQSRVIVLGMMVRVAAANGKISLEELKILRRMARAFELEIDAVENVLRGDEAFREVVIEKAGGSRSSGEPVPPRPQPSTFALDRERIAVLTQETREVISLLSVVMTDPEEAPAVSEETTFASSPQPVSTDWLEALDPRFHSPLLTLIERDGWAPAEFDSLAERHHLLPDDLFDSINVWSDEALGDFLLVRTDTVQVARSLLTVGQAPFTA